jgi:TolB-like protein
VSLLVPLRRWVGAILAAAVVVQGAALPAAATQPLSAVAVFPVENLSGGDAPLEPVRRALIERLRSAGVRVLSDAALESFITRHRLRYTAGMDGEAAAALRAETGAEGVLFASIELSADTVPPKFGLTARLVSTAAAPAVLWADDAGVAGDDAPGLFELGMANDPDVVRASALRTVGDSLVAFVTAGTVRSNVKAASKFRPRTAYRGLHLESGHAARIAVVPFINLSGRRNAGEILALLFMRHLSAMPQFQIVERGVVRRQLLDARIIMLGGVSLSDADTVAALVDADYVLGGRALRYDDYQGSAGRAVVEFSAVLIEKKTRKVVWSSDSSNDGTEKTGLFERETTRTAHALATQMVRLTAAMMAGRD